MIAATPVRSGRAVDASMDLLKQISGQPIDPEYARVAGAGGGRRSRLGMGLVALSIGALFTVAAVQTTRSTAALEDERNGLISRVQAAAHRADLQRDRVVELGAEIESMRRAALSGDAGAADLESRIDTLAPAVGAQPVAGPGMVVVVDDAPAGADGRADRVLDLDLQVLANGLWAAGAEAVAINGHRLSAATAIRSAGDAITVDYRSLTRPYRVEAIGDPRTLQASFAETAAGTWWAELSGKRRMRFEVSDARDLRLSADPGLALRRAKVRR